MNKTRNPLNEVQITELLMAADKKLGVYHVNILRRLIGEHKYLKEVKTDGGIR